MTRSLQFHLARRPNGIPVPDDFALVEVPLADAADREVQVAGVLLSVDPYMRPRLDAEQALGTPMIGGGIGRVTQSRNPRFAEGDLVRHGAGFRDSFVSDGKGLAVLTPDPDLPLSVYMYALGGTGITAYGGLLETGALKDSDQVLVSTAGGAVGSVASDVPTLIYAGSLDPATPVIDAYHSMRFLSHATPVEVQGAAHGPMPVDECTRGIATAFLADPTARPDMGCIAKRPSINFATTGLDEMLTPDKP